jgi:hypothetical protein
MPLVRALPFNNPQCKVRKGQSPNQGHSPIQKVALNGKAEPCITSGGKAEAKFANGTSKQNLCGCESLQFQNRRGAEVTQRETDL